MAARRRRSPTRATRSLPVPARRPLLVSSPGQLPRAGTIADAGSQGLGAGVQKQRSLRNQGLEAERISETLTARTEVNRIVAEHFEQFAGRTDGDGSFVEEHRTSLAGALKSFTNTIERKDVRELSEAFAADKATTQDRTFVTKAAAIVRDTQAATLDSYIASEANSFAFCPVGPEGADCRAKIQHNINVAIRLDGESDTGASASEQVERAILASSQLAEAYASKRTDDDPATALIELGAGTTPEDIELARNHPDRKSVV